jgi:hypothetical protein
MFNYKYNRNYTTKHVGVIDQEEARSWAGYENFDSFALQLRIYNEKFKKYNNSWLLLRECTSKNGIDAVS